MFVFTNLLWGLILFPSLRWVKAPVVSAGRTALATAVVGILLFGLQIGLFYVWRIDVAPAIPLIIVSLVVVVLLPPVVVICVFRIPVVRAFQAMLPTLAAPVMTFPFLYLMARLYLFSTFVIPTNAMAPTLLGKHCQGVCVHCGSPAFGSPMSPEEFSHETSRVICQENFHVTRPTKYGEQVFHGDRILVAKFLQPRRWDLMVFQYPEDPSEMYVMRLVGMPGEEITIRNGRVWANGKLLKPPKSIRGIKYLSTMDFWYGELWGAPDNPAPLADGEYFVFGDSSWQSKDSRHWERGAPGHRPFAVPQSHYRGVVTQ